MAGTGVEETIERVANAALVIYEAARKLRFSQTSPTDIADSIDVEIGELARLADLIRCGGHHG